MLANLRATEQTTANPVKPTLTFLTALLLVPLATMCDGTGDQIQEGEMASYLFGPAEKVPESFNAGFSLHAATRRVVRVATDKLLENWHNQGKARQ
jgi:hypothetical protein